ncbi:MAG: hypothetical protein ABF289_14765 [Clostridiales bacterium]
MLIKLMRYELFKKFKTLKNLFIGYISLQIVLLIILRVFFWSPDYAKVFTLNMNSDHDISKSFFITTSIYFVLTILIFLFPHIESIYQYERDLSGKQSILENMLPSASWKKIVSKLTILSLNSLLCLTLYFISIFSFLLVFSNFNISEIFFKQLEYIFKEPLNSLYYFLLILYTYFSFILIIYFCIAVSKVFSHKNKYAIPISILCFIAFISIITILYYQVEKIPIIEYKIGFFDNSLSSTLLDIFVFIIPFIGTAKLMDKKIEY